MIMIIRTNNLLTLFSVLLSTTVMLSFIPQQADARGGNRGGGGKARTSVNRNLSNNRNTSVNRNVNKNINVDVDVDRHYGCCGHGGYHPIATGVAIGATIAVVGSVVNTLPGGCTTIVTNGVSCRQCGSTWYEPRYSGNNVTCVVIDAP
jgi:hypothetical protein